MAQSKFKEGPELITATDDLSGSRMFIYINSRIRGKAGGGIRILPDITEKEVAQLGKTMTLKYGFFGLPIGGAKAGIRTSFGPESKERAEALERIGKKISPVLKSQEYIPGFDIGTRLSDLKALFSGAGKSFNPSNWRNITHLYTAWGMIACIEEALKISNDSLNGKTIAIEGFGKVGSSFALEAAKKGAIIIAVSNEKGALYSKKGLDANEMVSAFNSQGDSFVNEIKEVEKIKPDNLVSLECDIFAPCARFNPINEKNCGDVKARIVCAGHNMPLDYSAKKSLYKKGVIYLPGFIANAGGVVGAQLSQFLNDTEIKEIIADSFAGKVGKCIKCAASHNIPIEDVGRAISAQNFERVKKIEEQKTIIDRGKTFAVGKLPKKIGRIFVKKKLAALTFN